MYLQITTRCNMHCAHCCYSCGKKGIDMSMKTVRKAIEVISKIDDEFITIGGGEPTIHPYLWEILGLVFSTKDYRSEEGSILIVTNGKEEETVKKLAYLGKSCAISLSLSIDAFHEKVSKELQNIFPESKYRVLGSQYSGEKTCLSIRTVTRIIPIGRAKDFASEHTHSCPCPDTFINPNGEVFLCGCENSFNIGNIFQKDIITKISLVRDFLSDKNVDEYCVHNFKEKEFLKWIEDKKKEA